MGLESSAALSQSESALLRGDPVLPSGRPTAAALGEDCPAAAFGEDCSAVGALRCAPRFCAEAVGDEISNAKRLARITASTRTRKSGVRGGILVRERIGSATQTMVALLGGRKQAENARRSSKFLGATANISVGRYAWLAQVDFQRA